MKKRIAATLLVGAIAVSGVIGLSACGTKSVSMPKGEQVTKEVWEKAFSYEKISELKKFTASRSESGQSTVKGTVKIGKLEMNATSDLKSSSYGTYLYDVEGNKSYSEYESSRTLKTSTDDKKKSVSSKSSDKDYYELKEEKIGIKTYWNVDYSSEEYKTVDDTSSGNSKSVQNWEADTTTSFASSPISPHMFYQQFQDAKEDKDVKKAGTVAELYDSFKYSGGVYTATLYSDMKLANSGEFTPSLSDTVEYKVSVSINSDGFLVGYSLKADVKGTLEEDAGQYGSYKFDYTAKYNATYAITDIGSTDVSKKASKAITDAIAKAKADEEKYKDLDL